MLFEFYFKKIYERNEEEVEEGTAWTVSNITLKITKKKSFPTYTQMKRNNVVEVHHIFIKIMNTKTIFH